MPTTSLLLALLGVLAGAMLSVQAGVNAQLSRGLGHPVLASIVSFAAGLVSLVIAAKAIGIALPTRSMAAAVPVYAWFAGGLFGAGYLTANIFLIPRLGTAAVMSLVIGGQLLMAMLLDQYGLLGLTPRPVTLARLAGAAMLLGGAYLITRY